MIQSKEQLTRQIMLHALTSRQCAERTAAAIIKNEEDVATLQQTPPLKDEADYEADLRIVHNALTRYHTILTQEHASYPTEANQKYRAHVQTLADTTRDQIASLK